MLDLIEEYGILTIKKDDAVALQLTDVYVAERIIPTALINSGASHNLVISAVISGWKYCSDLFFLRVWHHLRIRHPLHPPPVRRRPELINAVIIPKKFITDAVHIAVATINEMDAIVSWNFQHIVKMKTIRLTEAANLKHGYRKIMIHSPTEVIDDE